jgi:small-conductance mechanosensitive channel
MPLLRTRRRLGGTALLLPLLAALLLVLAAILPRPLAAQEEGGAWFARDSLNAGLSPRPETFDLSSPQSTVESFLASAEEGRWTLAAHALDLTLIPPARQASAGPLLARQLYDIVDRKVLLRWSDLSERPDALVETGGSDATLGGQARKSLLLGILELDGRPVSIRLNRVKPEDGDPVWLFAAPTVDNVPALHRSYGPSEFEKALPAFLRVEALWGLRLWEILVLPVAIILIVLAALAVHRMVSGLADRRHDWRVRGLVRATRLPLALVTGALLLDALTQNLIVVSSTASAVLEPTILLVYVSAAILLVVNAIDAVLDRVVETDPSEMASPENAQQRNLATGISAARRFLLVIGLLLGGGIVLSSANIFRELGFSLLASAGVLTLVLAFAAREVLSNILSSLTISLNRSARIGDFLEFDGQWCTVERIYFTYVQLRLWTGNRQIVPVSYFVRESFSNWSIEEFKMLRRVRLKLASDAEVQPLRERMEAFCRDDERIDPVDDAFCYVTDQDEFGKEVLFAVPVPVPDAGWAVECALREFLLDEARRLDIALPAQPPRPEG